MTKIVKPGVGKKFSREEGFWFILNTLKEVSSKRVNIVDLIHYVEQKLVFRTIEAGPGISVNVINTGQYYSDGNPQHKIVISNSNQNGINVLVSGVPIGSEPALTLDFSGPFSAIPVSGGIIKIINESNNFNVSLLSSQINTDTIKNLNFLGNVLITESSPGNIDINVLGGNITVSENNVLVSGNPFNNLNFITSSGSSVISTSGNSVNIDLNNIKGFNDIKIKKSVYTGVTSSSGLVVLSGFFGFDNPDPSNIIININGLTLKYDTDILISDFAVSGNNLILILDNLNYNLEAGDEIQAYYWVIV